PAAGRRRFVSHPRCCTIFVTFIAALPLSAAVEQDGAAKLPREVRETVDELKKSGGSVVVAKGKVTEASFTGFGGARDEQLKPLGMLKDLEKLTVYSHQATDAGLAHLKPLTRLRNLTLAVRKMSDAGLANLKPLTKLETLHLGGNFSDAGLAQPKPLLA